MLTSSFLTQGPEVKLFESALQEFTGAEFAVAVNSATSALHIACLALGVEPGDHVWTSAISFVASANAAKYCGAEVDFVDIDSETFNMCPLALESKLVEARDSEKPLPKVVIPVAMAGQSPEMLEIRKLSKEFGFKVLEDASHALGARYRSNQVGSCEFSDVVVFSFHPVKMITTGEGGACLTRSAEIAERLRRLRSHGITRDPSQMSIANPEPWYYEQLELGFNYRITDFQCALGRSQLQRLDEFVRERNRLAALYSSSLLFDWLLLPKVRHERLSSFHLFIVRFDETAPLTRNEAAQKMRSRGLAVNLHYIPIYRQPYYEMSGQFDPSSFPNSERYYSAALTLPLYPGMDESVIRDVHEVLAS